jgi:type 2 lantibiotic biosynthesis protein LanM
MKPSKNLKQAANTQSSQKSGISQPCAHSELLEELISATKPSEVSEEILKLPFGEVFGAWIGVARAHLLEKFPQIDQFLSPLAMTQLENSLIQKWVKFAAPSFALELGVCRLENSLKGSTPQKRYGDFLHQKLWNQKNLRAFFEEYKELARLVSTFLLLWAEQAAEFLHRLEHDFYFLSETFNEGKALGKIVSLTPNFGDSHQGGRFVYLLEFESRAQIFYKPKNLSVSKIFHDLLEKLNDEGLNPPLKTYRLLCCEGYGWEERIEHLPCESQQQVPRFFERAGMLLCLFYLLDGTDTHHENLIAHGEFPVLIDLETLFQSKLFDPDRHSVFDVFAHSVLRTLFLPTFQVGPGGKKAYDISGLSAEEQSFSTPSWKNIGTDHIQRIFESASFSPKTHLLFCEGKPQAAEDHAEEIVSGFKKMYQFIETRRGLLAEKGGILEAFEKARIRIVLHGTSSYSRILERLCSPQLLLSFEVREEELDRYLQRFREPLKELFLPVIEAEKKALLQGDVPYFYGMPGGKGIYAEGKLCMKDGLDEASMINVHSRIENMNFADCENQMEFIQHSFYGKKAIPHSKESQKKTQLTPRALDREFALQEVKKIGEEILKKAIRSKDGSLGWIHLEPYLDTERYTLQPMHEGLYSGKMGIALFFSALFHVFREEKWKKETFNTLANLRKLAEGKKMNSNIRSIGIGGMSGVGGIIYGLCSVAKLLNEPIFLEDALQLVIAIEPTLIENDTICDVIGGSAGLLLALLTLWQQVQKKEVFALALHCGDQLCEKMIENELGEAAWKSAEGVPLLGFSHGTAGIAFALAKLGFFSKKRKFTSAAKKALAYERAHFCQEKKNWPRFGKSLEEKSDATSWCHGATGVGFARLASLPFLNDPLFLEEIDFAVKKTQQHLFSSNTLGICCGALGRLEFLSEISKKIPEHASENSIEEIIGDLLHRYLLAKRRKEFSKELSSPGFMQGLSGIGYTLLRLLDEKEELPQPSLLQ